MVHTRHDIPVIARQLLRAFDAGQQIAPPSEARQALTLEQGYAVASEIAGERLARGERIVGRKIGFTNRTIWPIYNVDAPVWGYVYDTGLHDVPGDGTVRLPKLPEMRIEPEIVFGLRTPPRAGMSIAELADCLDWVAHGVEIVTSAYPNWRFTAPDTAAAQALHGALWVGERCPAEMVFANGAHALDSFAITLSGPEDRVDGRGADVLGGPLQALRHMIGTLRLMPRHRPLAAGDVISTGTLTDARPIAPGQTWTTELRGCPLPGLSLRLV